MKDILARFRETYRPGAFGAPLLPGNYFSQVLDLGGIGLAVSTDGVGTKQVVGGLARRWVSLGVDLVALNLNDLAAVGARPIALLDCITMENRNNTILEELVQGICLGAHLAGISIPGGETAFLGKMIQGARSGEGFDLVGTALGVVPLDRIITGENLKEDFVLLGVSSSGLHSNGYTLAREILFEKCGYTVDSQIPGLYLSLGRELLRTTVFYHPLVLRMIDAGITLKALIHISGGGWGNLLRVFSRDVSFLVDHLPSLPRIFDLIQKKGGIDNLTMCQTYNLGIGFVIIISSEDEERAMSAIQSCEAQAYKIGTVVSDSKKRVFMPQWGVELSGEYQGV